MAAAQQLLASGEQSILLENIRWDTYEKLLQETGERNIHLTYDNGNLEIMTLSFGHEYFGSLIARLIGMLTLELDIPIRSGGSTTLKRKLKRKGLEPDQCFWIQHEARVRGKKEIDLKKDPPPDLAVEVDVSRTSLDRLPIYAALGVPEVWRFDGNDLHVYQLNETGDYQETNHSPTFPFLPLAKVVQFLRQSDQQDETSLVRSFVQWVRAEILPVCEGNKKKTSGRRNGKK